MADPELTEIRDAPDFKVLVNGTELPNDPDGDKMEVRVSDYVEGASLFTVTINNWHADRQEFKWLDEALFREGTEVDIKVGFADNLNTLIKGEITVLEPEFPEDEAPMLKIHGYDLLHRFRRGRKTRSFVQMKDSQIAEQIARDLQLRAQVEDSQISHAYVLQNNQSDIDFLLERARRIRYEVVVQDKTLHFRRTANDKTGPAVTLDYSGTLKSFYPRLSTMEQVSEVIVQGWNPQSKKPIIGRARQGDEVSKMRGQQLGIAISEQAFFKTQCIIVDTPIFSEEEAVQMARAKFNDIAANFVTGEGVAIGNTHIRAGEVIELTRLGRRFSGLYYVTSSTHVVIDEGYTTRFTVERTAT